MKTNKLLACIALPIFATLAFRFTTQEAKEDGSKIERLLAERQQVLTTRVEAAQHQHESGILGFNVVVDARRDLLNAKFESATTKAERIEILEQQLENLREAEDRVLQLRKVGASGGSELDTLFVISERLSAEIMLERELAAQ